MQKEIGRRLREIREKVGLSQAQLAELTGVDRSSVGRMENGRQRVPAEWLISAAAVLGVQVGDFYEGHETESVMELAEPYGSRKVIDQEALQDVIQGIEEGLGDLGLHVSAKKKAELAVLLYEMILEEESRKLSKERVRKILQLVA